MVFGWFDEGNGRVDWSDMEADLINEDKMLVDENECWVDINGGGENWGELSAGRLWDAGRDGKTDRVRAGWGERFFPMKLLKTSGWMMVWAYCLSWLNNFFCYLPSEDSILPWNLHHLQIPEEKNKQKNVP